MTVVSLTIAQPEPSARTVKGSALEVRESRCSTLVHPLTYGSSTEYTVNLYKGCSHGCVYCYAPSLTHDERRWGSYVDVKVNAPAVLRRELRGLRKDVVFLSSASDPYQPVEAKYRITRHCLEVLHANRFPVSVLTRSPLVLRDLDLLTSMDWVRVGMSITTVPVRRFELGVPPLRRRIDTLAKLADAGITTWVSLAPVIPGIVMVDLEELFEELSDAGVKSVSFGILRFAGYEESKKLFEGTAGMSFQEAVVGQDEMVRRLSSLVKKHGLGQHDRRTEWIPEPQNVDSLDSYTASS